jgi:phosphate transport system protein
MHRSFEDSLDKLRTRLIRMGSIVEEQVEFALQAVLEGNQEVARLVMDRDDKVDKLDMKIDKQCQKIFALHQPVASDLRLLLAALKINNELERTGDLAYNVARNLIEQPSLPMIAQKMDLQKLTSGVHAMVKGSLDAFVNNDPALAYHIMRTDNQIDSMTKEIFDETVAYMKTDASVIDASVGLLMVLRNLERMADQATNICENVIFLVEAKLVKMIPMMQQGSGDVQDITLSEKDDEDSKE